MTEPLLSGNGFDEELGVILPMADRLFIGLFGPFLKHDNLGTAIVGDHLGRHRLASNTVGVPTWIPASGCASKSTFSRVMSAPFSRGATRPR